MTGNHHLDGPRNHIILDGLSSSILGEYLAAIGLHRLVAGQADPTATLRWEGSTPVVNSILSEAEIRHFLADDAVPAPLVAPWNGSDVGGFHPTANTRGTRMWARFRNSTQQRLQLYREVITAVDAAVQAHGWAHNLSGDEKALAIRVLRNTLPDDALDFLDAAVVISDENVRYPALLGTGGNIGRLDLVLNYGEHLEALTGLAEPPKRGSAPDPNQWLAEVFSSSPQPRAKGTPGQYDGAGIGGSNLGRKGDGRALVNPWVYVLGLHGTLAFASAMSRRQGADSGVASAPFYVTGVAADYASAAQAEPAKGEFWAPVWNRPLTLTELTTLAGEGRLEWRGRQARSSTDAVRALKSFGVDRGLDRFERFGFIERNGQSPVAVHVGRHRIEDQPTVRLTAELDRWVQHLNRVGDDRTPAGVRSARNRLNRALFAAGSNPTPSRLRALLVEAARAERAASRSATFLESASLEPIPLLSTQAWLPALDDGSVEFGVAAALMMGRDSVPSQGDRSHLSETLDNAPTTLRDCLRATEPSGGRFERLTWARNGPPVPGLGERPLPSVLSDVMVLRARTRRNPLATADEALRPPFRGIRPQFEGVWAWRVPASHAEQFAAGQCDAIRLTEWLEALLLCRPRSPWEQKTHDREPPSERPRGHQGAPGSSPLWRFLAPWTGGVNLNPGDRSPVVPVMPPTWPARLRAGSAPSVIADARNRYAMAGSPPVLNMSAVGHPVDAAASRQVLAALLVPTTTRDLAQLLTANSLPPLGAEPPKPGAGDQPAERPDEPVVA